ncbi:gamma-glutamylcyclotransferase [Halobacteria archaeon AArc-m2/3/4]|uniref:Gamma-glutamylcyclotransferase n=2 Tax=Natronoglomus mannanivorans TaxID=2979990 RepID=A0ABT2QFJ1_9EURY|nr:gamma-glutamylcyclotransferase [Halobacteria archaeon AArc-m2/3/4]
MQVFVYGTLTDPDRAAAVLEADTHQFAGRATLEGLHRVEGQYPTLAPGGSVEGRLLEVDEAGLEALDAYEGVDRGLYVRCAVPRADEAGSVWTYIGDPSRLGLEERVSWPGEGPFRSRVESVIEKTTTVRMDHE